MNLKNVAVLLPEKLVDQLHRVSIQRKSVGLHPATKQDIHAAALKEWMSRHVKKKKKAS
jgi:hypothetical protein